MKEGIREEMDGFYSIADLLCEIDGFRNLTEEQQEKILLSLYIQNRVDRGDPEKYQLSENIINTWSCHGAIAALEGGRKPSQELSLYPGEFFDTTYFQLNSFDDLEEMVSSIGFPCVLHISIKSNFRSHTYPLVHSALVLGYDRSGRMITWEKQGYKKPFRISTLEETFLYFPRGMYWGVRRLRSEVNG